jgi:GPH family glycoside/pentoside/hexuronide:cation symporter
LIGTAFNILGAILTKWIAGRYDKKYSYIGALLISSVFCMGYYVVQPQNVLLIYFLNIIVSFVWGPVSVLQWAMYADAADYSEWKNNRRATGLIMAASLFALKLGLALGSGFLGWTLAYYGFVPNQTQTASTTHGIVMLMSIFPAVFGLIGAGLMFLYPLTNQMMQTIEVDLTARRAKA